METSATLADLPLHQKAKIVGYSSDDFPLKLIEFGFLTEVEIEVKCKTLWYGPILVSVGNDSSLVALRRQEAQFILIEKIEDEG